MSVTKVPNELLIDPHTVTQTGTGAITRTISSKLNEFVSVKDFGAVGDGTTDDTAAIQAALDTGKTVVYPEPSVGYLVSTISMVDEQTLIGAGKWANGIIGDGTSPTIACGNGTGSVRQHELLHVNVTNTNGVAIYVNNAPNFHISNSKVSSSGAHALDLYFSYRATIRDCWVSQSGAYTAINALDNVNGLVVDGNTITGGSAGRAIRIGQSQGVRVTNNIIESSYDGIWIASTSDAGDGNCNGVQVNNNYIEQCSTPFVLGKHFTVIGLVCQGNYVGNANSSIISDRTAIVTHGRLNGAQITDNAFSVLDTVENLVEFVINDVQGRYKGIYWARNNVTNTPAANLVKSGTYATSGSILADIGAQCTYDFGWGEAFLSQRVFVTETLTSNSSTTQRWFTVSGGDAQFGGRIDRVEILSKKGTVDCTVALGESVNYQANVASVDISTLTYSGGRADMVVASAKLDPRTTPGWNQYRVIAGTATGTFRIRITYRAN